MTRIQKNIIFRPWASRGATSPLRGNFGDSDFLKAHNVFNQIQVVCTLAVGASWRNKHLK